MATIKRVMTWMWRAKRDASTACLDDGASTAPPSRTSTASLGISSSSTCDLDSWVPDTRGSDPSFFHRLARFDDLFQGDFTFVKRLHVAIHGEVWEATWAKRGHATVGLKLMPNENVDMHEGQSVSEWDLPRSGHLRTITEDALTEIGVFCLLAEQQHQCPHIVSFLGALRDDTHTFLVMDFAEGGDLLSTVTEGTLSEEVVPTYVLQLVKAVAHLHLCGVGHRDISLENVSLKHGVVQLLDFGLACLARNVRGEELRYFRVVGKSLYRAPECYIPSTERLEVLVPKDGVPGNVAFMPVDGCLSEVQLPLDAVPCKLSSASFAGYAVPPVDVFAVGVCAFLLQFQIQPWRRARLKDEQFKFMYEHGDAGLEQLVLKWRQTVPCSDAMVTMTSMLQVNPMRRSTISDCLRSPWLLEGVQRVSEQF